MWLTRVWHLKLQSCLLMLMDWPIHLIWLSCVGHHIIDVNIIIRVVDLMHCWWTVLMAHFKQKKKRIAGYNYINLQFIMTKYILHFSVVLWSQWTLATAWRTCISTTKSLSTLEPPLNMGDVISQLDCQILIFIENGLCVKPVEFRIFKIRSCQYCKSHGPMASKQSKFCPRSTKNKKSDDWTMRTSFIWLISPLINH